MQEWALPSPPPSHSDSIALAPVGRPEMSHQPGDEMVCCTVTQLLSGLMKTQVGVEYDLLKRHYSTNKCRRPPSLTHLNTIRSNGTSKHKTARQESLQTNVSPGFLILSGCRDECYY